jgi:hypothetical protein
VPFPKAPHFSEVHGLWNAEIYIPEESKVIYQSKDGKDEKVFDPLEWLADMCSHVPNKGEQTVRYYDYHIKASIFPKVNNSGICHNPTLLTHPLLMPFQTLSNLKASARGFFPY